ncbi:MAG: HAD family hydrolase [Rhodothermales bacterium]
MDNRSDSSRPSKSGLTFDREASRVRFVYFDLDDTLLDHTHAEHRALQDMHASADRPLGNQSFEAVHALYRQINPVVWQKYSAGEFTKRQAKVGRFSQLLQGLGLDTGADEDLAHRYLDTYSKHWQPIEGAFEAFAAVASHLPTGILTNGFVEIQQAKLRQFPLLESLSDVIVISEEVGVLKPDPRLFAESARRAGMDAAEILYIGDSLSSDVEGGIGAGWKVAWFSERGHQHEDVHSFTDWSTLPDLVAQLA